MTKIEWCLRPGTKGETLNPIRARNKETGGVGHFCQHVSPGCENCYAERLQPRFRNPIKYRPQDRDKVDIYLDEEVLTRPLRWRAPRTIFWCSMTDYAAPWVEDAWLDKIFAVCALTPQHTHQLLTKYPERVHDYLLPRETLLRIDKAIVPLAGLHHPDPDLLNIEPPKWPLPNVWLGTSCEDQRRADERIPHLLATPAAVRFISYEPALEKIDLEWHLKAFNRQEMGLADDPLAATLLAEGIRNDQAWARPALHWIIAGGESVGHDDPDQRLIDWDWFRSTRDQCRAAGVAFFCKQGNKGPGWKDPIPEDLQIHQWPEVTA